MKMVMRSKEEDCDQLNRFSRTKWELCEMISDQVDLEAEQARRTRMGIIDDQVGAMWTATDPRNQENRVPPMRMFDREGVELRHPPYDPINYETPEYIRMMRSLDIANAELQGPPYDLTPEYVGLARSTRGTVFNVD